MNPQRELNFNRYPHTPGHKAQGTSLEAAHAMKSRAQTLRNLSLNCFETGAFTADDVADMLGESVLTIRPRISELVRMGLLKDSGQRKANASGKMAICWELNKKDAA